MGIPALILATGVALPLHPPGPLADGHWATAAAGTLRRHLSAGTHGHQGGHPVESGRPRARARHEMRPAATHMSLRQITRSDWVLVVRPQHRRPGPRVAPAQEALLEPGFLAHRDSAAAPVGPWLRIFDGQGKSWVNVTNVRAAQAPAGWDRLVVKIHPALRHVRTVSHLPSPLLVAPRAAAVLPAAPAATPAVAPQPAAPQVVQVVVQQPAPVVVQPALPPLQQLVHDRAIAIWGQPYDVELNYIISHESGWQLGAYNAQSGATGLFQALPWSKTGCYSTADALCQVNWGLSYIQQRYGTPAGAYSWWLTNGWY